MPLDSRTGRLVTRLMALVCRVQCQVYIVRLSQAALMHTCPYTTTGALSHDCSASAACRQVSSAQRKVATLSLFPTPRGKAGTLTTGGDRFRHSQLLSCRRGVRHRIYRQTAAAIAQIQLYQTWPAKIKPIGFLSQSTTLCLERKILYATNMIY